MKKLLLLSLLIPSIAFSQGWQIPNPAGTPRALPTPGTSMSKANIDIYGNQQVVTVGSGPSGLSQSVVPVNGATSFSDISVEPQGTFVVGTDTIEAASTASVLNLTAHAARVGDWIIPTGGTAGNIDVAVKVCEVVTANQIRLCNALPATPSTDAIVIKRAVPFFTPKEDSVHVSGDTGTQSLFVVNETADNLAVTGDYVPGAAHTTGVQMMNIWNSAIPAAIRPSSILKLEDNAHATGDAGVATLFVGEAAITASAATGDYYTPKTDTGGRTVVTNAPAGETWQACTGSITDTTQTAIKAGVASNRIYVTSFGCNNTASVASTLVFQDGATAIWQAAISNSTLQGVASYSMTFPTPLRGSVNTALNVTLGTTATNTRCCAAGYISTI